MAKRYPYPANFKILRGISLKKALGGTKVCPVCALPVLREILHVKVADLHMRQHDKKIYSSNCIYIHLHCWDKLRDGVDASLKAHSKEIKHNEEWVGAHKI